jgi:hypothetical protein
MRLSSSRRIYGSIVGEKFNEDENDNECDQSGSESVQPVLREESTEVKARILLSPIAKRKENSNDVFRKRHGGKFLEF